MTAPRGRLGAYAWWQARDYAFTTAAAATVLIPFVLGVFPLLVTKISAVKAGVSAAEIQNAALRGFGLFVGVLVVAGPLFSVAGMVSADRQPGLARFLFTKPVSVSAYYLQMWLVRGVGVLLIAVGLTQVVNMFVAPVPWAQAVAAVGVAWVLIGGTGYLLSVLLARDVSVLLGFYLLVTILDVLNQNLPDWRWIVKPVLAAMPPFHRLDEIQNALLRGTRLPMGDLWHALIFGTVCVALATYLVRRMPLVR